MAVATDNQQLRFELKQTAYDFDPDAATATDVAWVDAQELDSLLIAFVRTVGTSALTFAIIGNTAADGSGTDTTIKNITLAAQPDAVGDVVFGEVTRGEVMQAAADAGVEIRGVSAQWTVATDTDEAVAVYTMKTTHGVKDNTSDVVA